MKIPIEADIKKGDNIPDSIQSKGKIMDYWFSTFRKDLADYHGKTFQLEIGNIASTRVQTVGKKKIYHIYRWLGEKYSTPEREEIEETSGWWWFPHGRQTYGKTRSWR